jgi:Family of unknown function (DUF6498)
MTVETLRRGFGLYRRTAVSRSAVALVIANAIPLIGVLFFGWSLITILVLYWIENGIVGFWNIPKIALAQGSIVPPLPEMPPSAARAASLSDEQAESLQEAWVQARERQAQGLNAAGSSPLLARLNLIPRAGLAVFFLVHYGIFWLGHGFFVFTLPTFVDMRTGGCDAPLFPEPGEFPSGVTEGTTAIGGACASSFGEIAWGSVLIGAAALFLSHGASFLLNYIGNGEYQRTSAPRQMTAAYGRVIVLHLTILFGGLVTAMLGSGIGLLLILVGLKTLLDLSLHRREHGGPPATFAPA